MLWTISKIVLSALTISFCSWLSQKRPGLAGFLMALPLASMLALAFSYAEYQDKEASVKFARSILEAVPLSLVFFIPFLFAERLSLPFPVLYGLGLLLLVIGYLGHRWLSGPI